MIHFAPFAFAITINHIFTANERCRPSDGDSFDIVFHGYGSMPQPANANEVEAPNLLQTSTRVWKTSTKDHRPIAKHDDSSSQETQTVELAPYLIDEKQDIIGVPFTLAVANKEARAHDMSIVFCVWELNDGNTDILTFPAVSFQSRDAEFEFKSKFNLVAECSHLFPVRYTRSEWDIRPGEWFVGSFVQPSTCKAIVACIAYGRQRAHAFAITLPATCQVSLLRTILCTKSGSFVRINGDIVTGAVNLKHGDVVEFHAAEHVPSFSLTRIHKKVRYALMPLFNLVVPRLLRKLTQSKFCPCPLLVHHCSLMMNGSSSSFRKG